MFKECSMGKFDRLFVEKKKTLPKLVKSYIEDFLDMLEDLPYDIQFIYTRTIHRTRKLYDFIKLGWEDQDYDYGYLTDILKYKLDKMSLLHKNEGHAADHNIVAKRLRVASKALTLWQKDDYHSKYCDKKECLAYDYISKPSGEKGFSQLIRVYEGTSIELTDYDEAAVRKIYANARKFETHMKKKYKKIFFRIMYKYYESFWD